MHRGKRHDYLCMDLDCSEPGKVNISMIKYLHKIIQGFPEVIKGGAATPAAVHLLQVQKDGKTKRLPEEQALSFSSYSGAIDVSI